MAHGEILMVGIILLTVGIMPVVVPAAWRLMAAAWLAVFQVYTFPVHGFYPSLAFLCSIGLWPELLKRGKELLRWRITQYYFLLLVVQVISLAWSPDIGQGVRLIVLSIPFVFILAATIDVVGQRETLVRTLLYGIIAGAVIEASLVIAFHLVPSWDKAFRSSSLAHLFVNPNTSSIKRWSAFLVNPNTAAAYLGITSLLAHGCAFRYRQWWMVVVGLFLALGVFGTGSKAGMLLVFILYGMGMVILAWPGLKWWSRGAISLLLILTGVLIMRNLEMIAHFMGRSWLDRSLLWNFGVIRFPEHPLLGLGFGGWEQEVQEYVKQAGYPRTAPPPHNTIIALWSQSGLLAAVLGVLFIISALIFVWQSRTEKKYREFVVCLTLAMVWYFVHQQVDNWGLVNERHIMPIASVIIGICYALSRYPATRPRWRLASSPPAEDG